MIKVGIIDTDEALIRNLRTYYANDPDLSILAVSDSISNFLLNNRLKFVELDFILMEIMLHGVSTLEKIPQLQAAFPTADLIIYTVYEDTDKLIRAVTLGVNGYLLKENHLSEIKDYLNVVKRGGAALSPRIARRLIEHFRPKSLQDNPLFTEKDLKVLHLFSEGWSYKLIAGEMGMTIDGVKYYARKIYQKLKVETKEKAIKMYLEGRLPKA